MVLVLNILLVLLILPLVEIQSASISSTLSPFSNTTVNNVSGKIHMPLLRSKHNCTLHRCKYQKVTAIKQNLLDRSKRDTVTGIEQLADEAYGNFWMGTLTIGTPAQLFNVNLDTGSSDLWIPGQSCTTCGGTHKFNPSKSTTVKLYNNILFSDSYGSGSVTGSWAADTVTMAGLSITGFTFGIVTKAVGFKNAADGLMGMGYQSLNTKGQEPFVWAWYLTGRLLAPVFCFWLGPVSTGTDTGVMDLGGIDTSRYTGSITYAGVTVEGYWQFTVDSFRLSTMSSNIETSFQAILDTGTTLIVAPTVLRDHINEALGASYNTQSGLYQVNCGSSLSSFPNFIFTIKGVQFILTPGMYLQYTLLSNGQYFCWSQLIGGDSTDKYGDPLWTLGDTFIRRFYSVFDMKNNAIGLAKSSSYSSIQSFPSGVFPSKSG